MEREEKCKLAIEKGFKYNPETGEITGPRRKVITRKSKYGYIRIHISDNNKLYDLAGHQLGFYMIHGVVVDNIDHINGDRADNRICNLRSVTRQENNFNYTKVKGYYWNKNDNKYKARIGINGIQIHLGSFTTEDEARQAYLDAKEKHHKIKNP